MSHGCKTVEVKQLTSEAGKFEFQREAISSMDNVGEMMIVDLGSSSYFIMYK